MQKIEIKDFSCIKSASLELTSLTLVIGPQASGKSVISKLLYFCTSIISDYHRFSIEYQLSFEALERHVANNFCEWFPPSAWGEKRFFIDFSLGDFTMHIARVGKSGKVRIKFCPEFVDFYNDTHAWHLAALKKAADKQDIDELEFSWELRSRVATSLRKWLGPEMINNQLFIPAGRSFFTSVGKALVAFEHSGILDPVTLEFGRRYSALRERFSRRAIGSRAEPASVAAKLFSDILGGHLKTEGGKEYIQAADGRLIPFSALSSGQQELLPLAVAIQSMLPSIVPRAGMPLGMQRRSIYIEEPEAHLFPRAQNQLVEILATLVAGRRNTNLLLTTHSPYVLAKFNNLIKAGALGRPSRKPVNKSVARIIPELSWLRHGSINAYAIVDGKTLSIMDGSGLIDAEYLDEVSGDIAREFSQLLAIEVSE
ncbi:MAG: hypothetical protein C0490_15945 [Marivirga sp.]|nr:hypothetical protein [Marivirga sp.]